MEVKLSNKIKSGIVKRKQNLQWRERLSDAIKNPEKIVFQDDLAVAIYDAYPKAKYHYLVCPKEEVPTIRSVKNQHLNLLKHMHEIGENLSKKHENSKFLIGYHSIPSKILLHLHVVSNDFNSPCLKNKKHWNSFTTDFFLPSDKIIKELEEKGKLSLKTDSEYKYFLTKNLKCHKCECVPKNFPDLKRHLSTHLE